MDNDKKFISCKQCKQRNKLTKYNKNAILPVPKYIVENIKLKYKELKGAYDSPIDIIGKICQLQYKNVLVKNLRYVTTFDGDGDGYIDGYFVCPKCATDNGVNAGQCKNCDYTHESIWNDVILNDWTREIIINDRQGEPRVIGKIEYKVNNNLKSNPTIMYAFE